MVSILNDEITMEPTTIKRGPGGEYLEVTEPPIRAKIANLEPDYIRRYEEIPSGHHSEKRNREASKVAELKISPGVIIAGGLLLGVVAVLGVAALAQAAPPAPPPEGYPCPYCPEVFLTLEELVAHIQSVHPGERIPIHIIWQ